MQPRLRRSKFFPDRNTEPALHWNQSCLSEVDLTKTEMAAAHGFMGVVFTRSHAWSRMNMIGTRCLKSAPRTVSPSDGLLARRQWPWLDRKVPLHPVIRVGYDAASVAESRPRVGSRMNSL